MSVYWITGLSGAGKTTIGKELHKRLKEKGIPAILLDGDELRAEAYAGVFGYTLEERRKGAMCYARLCNLLARQGIVVICCTISMFDNVRLWNRENIQGYIEIYVKVPFEILQTRNQKGLYSATSEGANVMGVDLQFEEPKSPDVVIENDGRLTVEECVKLILER